MVQQYRSPVRVYKHPFELVMAAYEKRFPTCKMIPIFLGSDITSEFKSEDGARHVVERRCKLAVDAPYLVKKIIGVEFVYFIQKNALDRRARTLDIEAHNESFSSRVIIKETCKYYVHPENSSWTCFEQTASLDIKSFLGFENAIEKLAIKQYSHNISKGKEVIEYYIAELLASGHASQLVPFSETEPTGARCSKPSEGERESEERAQFSGTTQSAPGTSTATDQCNSSSNEASDVLDEKASNGGTEVRLSRASSHSHSKADGGSSEMAPKSSAPDKDDLQTTRVERSTTITSSTTESSTSTLAEGEQDMESKALGLDEDYIQRYLGSLTPLEVSRLLQLREAMVRACGSKWKGRLPSDATMLRFLRARACNVEKARAMLSRSLRWRRRYAIDRLLATHEPCEVLSRYFSGGWHYFDKQHRPLYLLRLGAIDVKGLLRSCGEERVLRHVLAACEEAVRKLSDATKVLGHAVSACTIVLDLDGLGMRHLWRPGVRTLMRILQHLEANYPEMMNRVLVVRAPRIFPILWTLVSPFIDDATRQKFVVFSGREHLGPDGLQAFVDRQHLPMDLGGECEWCAVPEGGLVPKSAYRTDQDGAITAEFSLGCVAASSSSDAEDEEDDDSGRPAPDAAVRGAPVDQSALPLDVYSVASIDGADGFEVRYQVAHAGSVITWDFEVLDGDVEFRLFSVPASADADSQTALSSRNASPKSVTSEFSTCSACGNPLQHTRSAAPVGTVSQALRTAAGCAHCDAQRRAIYKAARHSTAAISDDSGVSLSLQAAKSAPIDAQANAFETPQVFKHGASVQGSHLATRHGLYVLRWTTNAVNLPRTQSATKLSYYTELVTHDRLHGSLTSLRSCRSSFCSLDIAAS